MTTINNKTAQDAYAQFNKLGQDAASNKSSMGSQVVDDVKSLFETVGADSDLSDTDKKSLGRQVADLLPMAGESGHGAEWNADMQKLVHQLASAHHNHSTSSASSASTTSNAASTTTNQQVFSAYNTLNTLAATNDANNSNAVQTAAQNLLSMVQGDSALSSTQQQDLESKITSLLQIAGKAGNGTEWNTQMQALVSELSSIAQGGASSSSTSGADGSTTASAASDPTSAGSTGSTSSAASSGSTGSTDSSSDADETSASTPTSSSASSGSTGTAKTVVPSTSDSTVSGSDTSLYPSGNGPTLEDIQQGSLNDCTIDAALSSMVQSNPSSIENMISKNSDGTYNVELYPGGVATSVNVNSSDIISGGTTGSNGTTDWASIIEAAAKKSGFDLDNANGAQPGDAMELLTGTGGMAGNTSDFGTEENLETSLQTELASGKIVIAGTGTSSTVDGTTIDADHAYSVLGVANGEVTLRNPWANQANNGVITMSVADYAKAFQWTYMQD